MTTPITAPTREPISLQVEGMSCTNCALGVEKYLESEGVKDIYVDFAEGEAAFTVAPNESEKLPQLVAGIERLGYRVQTEETASAGWGKLERYVLFASIFTFPLLLHMFIDWAPLHNPWIQFALATPVFLLGLWHFGRSAVASLRSGVPNMDVLIILGATAAYGYSLYGALTGGGMQFLFFETAATIITLVLIGNLVEHRAVRKTTDAVRDLSRMQMVMALRLRSDKGSESLESIPNTALRPGDTVLINEGDRVPADAKVQAGSAWIDASMLTGESRPVEVGEGAAITGGTVVVEGNLRATVEKVGRETVLSQIIQLVKRAQADKPAIQRLADRISAVFVPAVLAIAVATFLLSYYVGSISLTESIIRAVAVLVISCPCAMGLATPTAVVVGIGRASRNGLLIKGGRTLEQFQAARYIVFDKTGTLTTGKFGLQDFHALAGADPQRVKGVVLALEQRSSHPIARALREAFAGITAAELVRVEERKGRGMEGVAADGTRYELGSHRLVADLPHNPQHNVFLLRDGKLWASLQVEDRLQDEAQQTVDFLKKQGLTPVMLTGDRQDRADFVAQALGIDRVYAEQLPDDKLRVVEQLAAEATTIMVGDGINDAPALARAHVGISLGNATQVAIQSAEIILLNGQLASLRQLFAIGKHTVRTIRQNLFWAFAYNIVAIPLAALGFLSPMLGALAMAFSDVIVVGNSLRLRVKRIW